MSTSTRSLACALTTLGLLMASSCGRPAAPAPRSVTIEFENAAHAGHQRYLAIDDLTVSATAPAHYDLGLASDRPGGMQIEANGTRNLAHAGTGSEASFRRLVRGLERWNLRELPAAAERLGIVPGERPADYWTPVPRIVQPGTILAIRQDAAAPASGDEQRPPDIKALVYVQSIDGNERMVLLVARARKAHDR